MLKITSPVLRSGLVAAVVTLLPLTEAAATGGEFATDNPNPAGRSCTLTLASWFGKSVQIIAGPLNTITTDPALATAFPVTVTNTTDSNCPMAAGTCLRWDYKWIYTSLFPSKTFVTLDSDLSLFASPGGTQNNPIFGDSSGIGFGVAEVRVVRFSSTPYTRLASIYTSTDAKVGKVTAAFQSSDGKRGFCGIQGAEKSPVDTLLTQPQTITSTVGPCTITWAVSPDGCVTGASATPLTCTVSNKSVTVGTGVATTATCGTEVSGPFGSTEVCRWNSFLRKTTCVTIP